LPALVDTLPFLCSGRDKALSSAASRMVAK